MTGNLDDLLSRIKSTLAPWFPNSSPILDGLLAGFANVASWVYGLIAYARLQTRVATATDGFLDLIAYDFFGRRIRRGIKSDDQFRAAIVAELFRPRATRQAIIQAVTDLTGIAPVIFEPARPQDTGGYAPGPAGDGRGYGLAYGLAGGYGSLMMPYEILITAYRPATTGIANVIGYNNTPGAYSTPSQIEYGSLDMIQGSVTDADIMATIHDVIAAGITAWVQVRNSSNNLDTGYEYLMGMLPDGTYVPLVGSNGTFDLGLSGLTS